MTHILTLLILFVHWQLGEGQKVQITADTISAAWQSSASSGICFRDSGNTTEHGLCHFYSGRSPDAAGYQWLLLELKSSSRVLSVTVHGSLEVPARTQNIEILLGDRLPNGMRTTAGNCSSTFTDRLQDYFLCGRTRSYLDGLAHEVKCNASVCTRYILIRKFVLDEKDRRMDFEKLEVEKVPNKMTFHACSSGGGRLKCNKAGLITSVAESARIVMVCLPCLSIRKDQSNCSVISPEGTKVSSNAPMHVESQSMHAFDMAGEVNSCLLVAVSKHDIKKHGWHFQCDVRLASGEIFSGTEPMGFVALPRNVHIRIETAQFGHQKLLVAERIARFTFVSDFAFPKPFHNCWISDSPEMKKVGQYSQGVFHDLPTETGLQGQPLKLSTQNEEKNGSFIRVFSDFEFYVNASVEGMWIRCRFQLEGQEIHKAEPIPTLLYPCKTTFSMPQSSSWTDGSANLVTVESSGSNIVPTSHMCFIDTNYANTSLVASSTTNMRSTFLINVKRQWGKSASLVCLVNQSGFIVTWTRQLLPAVLYKANNLAITNLPASVYEGINITFTASSENGNPSPDFSCRVRYGEIFKTSVDQTYEGYQAKLNYIPDRQDTRVECSAVQMDKSNIIFSQRFFQNISVLYRSVTKMYVSPGDTVKEGSTVKIALMSIGGRPAVTSFKCWIGEVQLLMSTKTLTTNSTWATFLLNASRIHNRLILRSHFKQDKELITRKKSVLNVHFPANKPDKVFLQHTLLKANSALEFALRVSDIGNPPAKHFCYIGGRKIEMRKQASNTDGLSLWYYNSLVGDNNKAIMCYIVQECSRGISVYNQTVSSDPLTVINPSINSWTATQLLKLNEGELLSVSVTSVGGNPAPSHQCWLQTAENRKDSAFTKLSYDDKAQLVTNFSVASTRHMNTGSLMCRVTQEGQADMTQIWSQFVTVLFDPFVDVFHGDINETHINAIITVSEGNPRLGVYCYAQQHPDFKILWKSGVFTSGSLHISLVRQNHVIPTAGFINICCKVVKSIAEGKRHSQLEMHSSAHRILKCATVQRIEGVSANYIWSWLFRVFRWVMGILLMLGLIIAAATTAYLYIRRRRENLAAQGQSDSSHELKGMMTLKSVCGTERDPSKAYYYAEC